MRARWWLTALAVAAMLGTGSGVWVYSRDVPAQPGGSAPDHAGAPAASTRQPQPRLTADGSTAPSRSPSPEPGTPGDEPVAGSGTAGGTASPRRPAAAPSPGRAGTGATSKRAQTARPAQLGPTIRAAFYYPWFPEAWRQQGRYPFTNFSPTLYDGDRPAVVDRHIADMRYAGLQAGIASWWGIGSRTDSRVRLLLDRARPQHFRWSLYYEREGTADPIPAQISADLRYIRSRYATDPSFLTRDGRAVIFVYAGSDGCDMSRRWAQADTSGFYVVLKVFQGYRTCDAQPDSWHQYAPAERLDVQAGYSAAVSPGFWLAGSAERLTRDLKQFRQAATRVATSDTQWHLVTTYNEWGEGTAVETAREWASGSGHGAYLDVLHEVFTRYPAGSR